MILLHRLLAAAFSVTALTALGGFAFVVPTLAVPAALAAVACALAGAALESCP